MTSLRGTSLGTVPLLLNVSGRLSSLRLSCSDMEHGDSRNNFVAYSPFLEILSDPLLFFSFDIIGLDMLPKRTDAFGASDFCLCKDDKYRTEFTLLVSNEPSFGRVHKQMHL
ncbi:unnamed protein product [Anisakis simplex]|uniref:Uncharacterized protein n=1 Tax=Anisakis simplex TaxID=6269 RepID=A0A0M3J7W6_ANISI|nr:unnamed protein product [Anisakis simplex]